MIENVRKVGKRNMDMKKYILKTFSTSSWKKLSVSEKARHTFKNCEMCLEKFQTLMDAFPVNKNARLHSKQKAVDMSELQNKTMEIYEKASCELKKSFPGIEFNEAQIEVPKLHLQKKVSSKEKQKETRKSVNHFKKSVEKHLQETAVVRTFGTDISFSKRNKIRMLESFETKEECEKIATGKKSKKDHVGTNTSWDQETCVNLVESYPDGYKINFSELARIYLQGDK